MEQNARGGKAGRLAKNSACQVAECRTGRIKGKKVGLKPGLYKLFWANGIVDGDGAKGPDAIVNRLVADGGHEGGEFGRAEKAGHGFREILVSRLITRDKTANLR